MWCLFFENSGCENWGRGGGNNTGFNVSNRDMALLIFFRAISLKVL